MNVVKHGEPEDLLGSRREFSETLSRNFRRSFCGGGGGGTRSILGVVVPLKVWNPDPAQDKNTLKYLPHVGQHPLFLDPVYDNGQNSQFLLT